MKGLMVSTGYLDVRAGRHVIALNQFGHTHDGLCFRVPPQFPDVYGKLDYDFTYTREDIVEKVAASDADVIHVHMELYGSWLVEACKEGARGRPVIVNVHDLVCARNGAIFDRDEEAAFELADALVWVTDEQRDFARECGLNVDGKPSVIVPNYPVSVYTLDKSTLSHLGGVVCSGGFAKRGESSDRDHSPISDAFEKAGIGFHIYPGGPDPDYGIVHEMEHDYPLYIERLSAHDFGFAGTHFAFPSWTHSVPTRVGEYLMAGLPVLLMNVPKCQYVVDAGMGVMLDSVKDIKRVKDLDQLRMKKNVLENRRLYTMERIVGPLSDLYREVTS